MFNNFCNWEYNDYMISTCTSYIIKHRLLTCLNVDQWLVITEEKHNPPQNHGLLRLLCNLYDSSELQIHLSVPASIRLLHIDVSVPGRAAAH